MKLVDDWKEFHRWASVRLAAISAAALEAYNQFPQFQEYVSPRLFHHTMSVLVFLIIAGRIIQWSDNAK